MSTLSPPVPASPLTLSLATRPWCRPLWRGLNHPPNTNPSSLAARQRALLPSLSLAHIPVKWGSTQTPNTDPPPPSQPHARACCYHPHPLYVCCPPPLRCLAIMWATQHHSAGHGFSPRFDRHPNVSRGPPIVRFLARLSSPSSAWHLSVCFRSEFSTIPHFPLPFPILSVVRPYFPPPFVQIPSVLGLILSPHRSTHCMDRFPPLLREPRDRKSVG